jgi:hypothetical protein
MQYLYVNPQGAPAGVPFVLGDTWENISHPASLSEAEKISLGLYPVQEDPKPSITPLSQYLDPTYTILTDRVRVGWQVRTYDNTTISQRHTAAMTALRVERNRRLTATDWTQLQDTALAPTLIGQYRQYRTALRNLPGTVTDPYNVAWPVEPGASMGAMHASA